ncbi:MAG: thioredoxin family protein [Candidatus Gastranaerophilales bacterium]|nr:thioredoxin family protein [Candidatus Gastranaerophilales bacterium]
MSKKINLLIIAAIFVLPILLFYTIKSPSENIGSISFASNHQPYVYKFSSKLCMDCKKLKQTMDTVKPNYSKEIVFVDVNVNSPDRNSQMLVKKYDVKLVPTLVFVDKDGNMVKKIEGSMPKAELEKYLEELKNG